MRPPPIALTVPIRERTGRASASRAARRRKRRACSNSRRRSADRAWPVVDTDDAPPPGRSGERGGDGPMRDGRAGHESAAMDVENNPRQGMARGEHFASRGAGGNRPCSGAIRVTERPLCDPPPNLPCTAGSCRSRSATAGGSHAGHFCGCDRVQRARPPAGAVENGWQPAWWSVQKAGSASTSNGSPR